MQENEYPGNGQPPVSDMPPTEGHTPSTPQSVPPAADLPAAAPPAAPPAAARAGREAVRRSTKKASACFGSACAPAPLVTGLVLLLLFAMGAWLLYEFAAVLLSAAGAPDVCYPVAGALAVLAFLWFGMPAAFGRMRLSGLLLKGERVHAGELLHYYRPQLLCRSFLLSLIHLAALFLPLAVAVFGVVLSRMLFVAVLLPTMNIGTATLIFLGLAALSLVLGVVLFLISGLFYFTAGFAVGNEQMPLLAAVRASVRTGTRNMRAIAVFRTQNVVYIFLSLLTVGVLYVLYFGHRIQLTYLDLCETLKGDSE